jgi:hypothetical protein
MSPTNRIRSKTKTVMRTQERINLIRRVDKQMKCRKESNMIKSVNHQNSKMNTRKNEHRLLKISGRKKEK